MSRLYGQDMERQAASATEQKSWERPATADDIVDPIDAGPGGGAPNGSGIVAGGDPGLYREQSDEEAEDVPLDVKFTDALSMLADGGHDYGSTPLAAEDPLVEDDGTAEDDAFEIDESSKDA